MGTEPEQFPGMLPMWVSASHLYLATLQVMNLFKVSPAPAPAPAPGGLEPTYPTLAEHLSARGYTNHLVGKWHLGQSKVPHWEPAFCLIRKHELHAVPQDNIGYPYYSIAHRTRRSTTPSGEGSTPSTVSWVQASTTGPNSRVVAGGSPIFLFV